MTPKKDYADIIAERNQHRKLLGKTFTHNKSGGSYQLTNFSINTETQELTAEYCDVRLPLAYRFNRPMSEFLEKFTEA